MIKITVPIFQATAQSLRHSEAAMRAAVSKAMTEAQIPYIWRLSEDRPQPAAPGKLTFFHDRLMDQFEITWEPKDDLPSNPD